MAVERVVMNPTWEVRESSASWGRRADRDRSHSPRSAASVSVNEVLLLVVLYPSANLCVCVEMPVK